MVHEVVDAHVHTHTHSHTLSLTHTHSHTFSLSHTHTHSLTHTCTHTHTHTHLLVDHRLQRICTTPQREFFIDNLLVRVHFIIVMIRWTGLAP